MSYSEGQNKIRTFSVRLPDSMRDQIQKIADREKVLPAFIVRKAIEMLLEQDRKDMGNE